jgi:site-specific recombinase XerD
VKGLKHSGVRIGNWLSQPQVEQLLRLPDTGTHKGKRDRALLAVMIGCGVRRGEVATRGRSR